MKILALVDTPDHVCCRYRVLAFEPALNRQGATIQVEPIGSSTPQRLVKLARLNRGGVVLLQRKLLPGWQLRLIRARAERLVFDFDDAVLYRDSYDPRGPHCPRRARRFTQTVRLSDEVIAGNDFLADCALRAGATPDQVRVIPTCVPTSDHSPRHPDPERVSGSLDLVWIGSSSTLQGLEGTRALWDRIGREVPGVRLRVICDRFPDLGAMPVVSVPWSEATETAELARGDVGVSWIPDDLWSRGKCGLKVLQYQAARLPVLANPVGVHPEMIRAGVNGFLPETDDDWVNAVRALAADPSARARMGGNARSAVEEGYSIPAWEGAFVATLAGVGRIPAPGTHLEAAREARVRRPRAQSGGY